jgi:hypothetical protein
VCCVRGIQYATVDIEDALCDETAQLIYVRGYLYYRRCWPTFTKSLVNFPSLHSIKRNGEAGTRIRIL